MCQRRSDGDESRGVSPLIERQGWRHGCASLVLALFVEGRVWMKRILNFIKGVLGLAALAAFVLVLVGLFGPLSQRIPVAQRPYPVVTATWPGPPLPTTPTPQPYPPPVTPIPPMATPTPPVTVTPPLPVPTLVPIPVPPEILASEKIAFLRDKDLQLINVASRALAQVTTSGNVAHIFGWSHDGSQLLLGVGERPVLPETDMPGGTDLWVLDVREGRAVQLTEGLEVLSAAWSPLGAKIAYVTRYGELYIVHSDGTELRKMPTKALPELAWAPDGTKLAYILPPPVWEPWNLLEAYDIAVLDPVDGSVAQLTSGAWTNFHPVWSLDSKKILFESDREHAPGTGLWYTMNADGSELQHLEKPALLSSMNVDRSPIADQVAYEVSGNIWVMDFEGNAVRVAEGFDPSWSPNGSKLAYVGRDGGIWVIKADGTGPEKLSEAGSQPHWSD
jgi:Tol biopolymer transport system component